MARPVECATVPPPHRMDDDSFRGAPGDSAVQRLAPGSFASSRRPAGFAGAAARSPQPGDSGEGRVGQAAVQRRPAFRRSESQLRLVSSARDGVHGDGAVLGRRSRPADGAEHADAAQRRVLPPHQLGRQVREHRAAHPGRDGQPTRHEPPGRERAHRATRVGSRVSHFIPRRLRRPANERARRARHRRVHPPPDHTQLPLRPLRRPATRPR